MMENRLVKTKVWNESDAGGCGGGASGNNVRIFHQLTESADPIVFAVLFRKFTYWPYCLKEETIDFHDCAGVHEIC